MACGFPRRERSFRGGTSTKKIIALQNVVVFSGHKKNDNGAVRGGREKGQQIFSLQNLRKKNCLLSADLKLTPNSLVWPAESVRVLQYKKNWYCFPDCFTEMGAI